MSAFALGSGPEMFRPRSTGLFTIGWSSSFEC
jgi:hypothetical protein